MKFGTILIAAYVALLVFVFFVGCESETTLVVSSISGPTTVDENTSESYAVSATGDTGIAYLWAIDPATVGTLAIRQPRRACSWRMNWTPIRTQRSR